MFEELAGGDEPGDGAPDPDALGDWAVPGRDRPAGPPVAVVLPPEVAALQAAVAGLAGWQPQTLDGPVALASLTVLLAAEQGVMSARTRSLSDLHARKLHRLDDARTTGSWLTQHGHDVPAVQVTLARRLSALPLLADELATGRVSVAVGQRLQATLTAARPHLDRPDGLIDGQPAEEALYGVVVNGVRGLCCQARGGYPGEGDPQLLDLVQELLDIYRRPASQLARLEAALLVLARQLDAHGALAQLPGALRQLLDSLLPAQLEERARAGERERGLELVRKHDGSGWRIWGDLDLETGEAAFTVLSGELRRDPDNPTDTVRARQLHEEGLDPHDPAHDLPEARRPRSRRERMHDALGRALGRYLAADLGGEHDKTPVQISAVVTTDTLDGRPGAAPAVGGSGTSLPVSLVRRWAYGSALTRLVMSLPGRVLEVSHTERTLTSHERRALYEQTGGRCQRRGCARGTHDPGAVMHPHHTEAWARSGTTSLGETALLCTSCHSGLHHGSTLTLKDGRRLGPDGWIE